MHLSVEVTFALIGVLVNLPTGMYLIWKWYTSRQVAGIQPSSKRAFMLKKKSECDIFP